MNKTDQYVYQYKNIPLFIFDIICLPIHLVRLILIYFWGSKYNFKGFQFLDVIMHADNPYFNQEDCRLINTIGKDYRVVIRDDSRIFPLDIKQYINIEKESKKTIFLPSNKSNILKVESNTELDTDIDTYSTSNTTRTETDNYRKHNVSKIKGLNYYESNDENINDITKNKKSDILDSIREELNSAFNDF